VKSRLKSPDETERVDTSRENIVAVNERSARMHFVENSAHIQ